MLNRKLLEILSHLTAAEHKRLGQFLNSPYFNNTSKADEIVRLYDYILRHGTNGEDPALSKEVVFRLFFPDKQFREKVKSSLDELTSELFGLVRRFLAQMEIERKNTEISEYLALCRFYQKFSYEERFWNTIQTMRKMQQHFPLRDSAYFFDQFRIEEEEHIFRGMYNSYEDDNNLNAVHINLDLNYSILKLEYACSLAYQKRISRIEQSSTTLLVDSILELSEEGGPLDIPIIRIYRVLIDLLQKPHNSQKLDSLVALIEQYQNQIPFEKLKTLKAFIRFFWLQEYYKSGDDFSLRHTFDIYREQLTQGYFYFDNHIPFHNFRNIVIFALKLGEFDWVNAFIEDHPPERICGTRYPIEVHSLNVSEYYFYLKEYDSALEKLVYRPFENATLGILADMLLIKIYYETNNELLESRMYALDQKVRRSKLNKEMKSRYYNFLKKLDKIIKYGQQTKNPKRARLIEEIKTMSNIGAREWLLEKLK